MHACIGPITSSSSFTSRHVIGHWIMYLQAASFNTPHALGSVLISLGEVVKSVTLKMHNRDNEILHLDFLQQFC